MEKKILFRSFKILTFAYKYVVPFTICIFFLRVSADCEAYKTKFILIIAPVIILSIPFLFLSYVEIFEDCIVSYNFFIKTKWSFNEIKSIRQIHPFGPSFVVIVFKKGWVKKILIYIAEPKNILFNCMKKEESVVFIESKKKHASKVK